MADPGVYDDSQLAACKMACEMLRAKLAEAEQERDSALAQLDTLHGHKFSERVHEAVTSRAEVAEAEVLRLRLRDAAAALCAKLHAVEKPVNASISIANAHNFPYTGPNWGEEIAALEALLKGDA